MTHDTMSKVRHIRFDEAAETALSDVEQHLAGQGLRPSSAVAIRYALVNFAKALAAGGTALAVAR